MMHNTYSSYSSIISLRTRSFALNDYNSCNYPSERCPSICYCSCCCSFPVNSSKLMLPMNLNPSLLYGLRQSTLIQLPPSRRIFFGSNDRYCYRSSIYDVGCCCCGESCCVEERMVGRNCKEKCCVDVRKSVGVDSILGRSCQKRYCFKESKNSGVDKIKGCQDRYYFKESNSNGIDKIKGCKDRYCSKESKSNDVDKIRVRMTRHKRDFRCNALGDAEAMLSLLSEDGMEECVLVRERSKSSFKDARVKERNVSEKSTDVKDDALSGSGYLESKYRMQDVESRRVHAKEDCKKREERESLIIDDEKRLRRRKFGSSYYSVLDSGEFESDSEVDVKQERFVGESLTSQGKDSRKTGGVVLSAITRDDSKSYLDEKDQQLICTRHNDVGVGSAAEWDWRKKSEKKLTEESAEVTKSMKDSIMSQSKLSQVNESNFMMASSSKKQFSNQEQESTSDLSSRRQSRSNIRIDDSGGHEHTTTDIRFHEHSESHFKTANQVSGLLISSGQPEQSTSQSQITLDNQESAYLKSNWQHEQSSQANRQNVETTSTTMRRAIQGKGALVVAQSVQGTGCDYCSTCGRSMEESNTEFDIQQHSELSQIHDDARWTKSDHSQSERRHRKQEMGTSSFQRIVEEGSKQQDELHLTAGKIDARRIYQQYSETLGSDYSYDQSSLRLQQQTEMQMSNLEDNSSLKSSQEGKKLQEGSSGRLIKKAETQKLLQSGATASQVLSTSVEINHHSASDKRINKEQTYSTSKLKAMKKIVEKHELVDETFMQTRLRTEVQSPVLQVGLTGNFSGEANTSQETAGSFSQTGVQQVGEIEAQSDLQLIVMSPSYQLIRRSSSDSEPASSFVRGSTGRTEGVDTASGHSQPRARTPSSSDETNESGFKSEEEFSPENAISLAERMQESSTQIVGEFVDKMRHESSASGTRIEKELPQLDEINILTGSTQSQTEKAGFPKQDSIRISGGSRTSVGEASQLKPLHGESSESAVSRRTGKSLWNIVSGLFRLRWVSSETQKSPVKSSQKSSSNDSISSETWFSGNEQDEGAGDSMTRKQIGVLQEPTSSDQPLVMRTTTRTQREDHKKKEPASEQPIMRRTATKRQKKDRSKKEQRSKLQEPTLDQSQLRRTTGISQTEDFRLTSLDDRLTPDEVDVSSSTTGLQGGSVTGGVSIRANTDFNITQQTSVSNPLSSLVSSARQLKRSDAFEEIEEVEKIEEHTSSTRLDVFEVAGRNEELISSTSELKDHSVNVMESGVSTSEETNAELKRRKLQRSKQVISERFDEWEDAYRRENEQRKVDEIFMKEALAEAIKAADSWEVPVGAVLVQDGKIIARGYNLVEELRDSTAHAEMICIREASNILRTWRLSETTLYVTLEPCPMCAGAILQARIKTLVWGAPNKLIGADGSWIRLFPEGIEGDQRSEVADKPAATAHPFHPKMNIRRGVLESECSQAMQQFFRLRRKKEKAKEKKSEEAGQPSCLPVPHNPIKLLRKMHGVFHIT